MAKATIAAPSVVPQFPQTNARIPQKQKTLPSTFRDALKQGWGVISDKSNQSTNQKRREGTLRMQKRGVAGLLQVDYVDA